MRATTFILALHLAIATAIADDSFTGRVLRFKDGDTCVVLRDSEQVTVRMLWVDAPESKQPFGVDARKYCESHALGRDVSVRGGKRDRYGRLLGEVLLEDGSSLNLGLIKWGFAWSYMSKEPATGDLQHEAQLHRRGLWASDKQVPPWDWRKGKR